MGSSESPSGIAAVSSPEARAPASAELSSHAPAGVSAQLPLEIHKKGTTVIPVGVAVAGSTESRSGASLDIPSGLAAATSVETTAVGSRESSAEVTDESHTGMSEC